MATQITHVAIVSNNYTLLARFYDAVFGMKASPEDSAETAFSVSDGYVGMNINPRVPGRQAGFDHFGFQVDDVEAIYARVREAYPDIQFLKRPGNRTFAGVSGHDPAGNVFDLSQHGMANRAGVYLDAGGRAGQNARHIKHFALRAVQPALLARFYRDVFDLQEEEKDAGDANYYLTDGTVTMVIMPWHITDYAGSGIERPALDHLGFAVESLEQFKADMERLRSIIPALAPMPIRAGAEGSARLKLFMGCRYGQYQIADPDGVLIDVTEG
jgi:predicted enzyme related to lactoylglutathione lyase